VTWDTSNSTAADRVRLYVNGTRLTVFDTSVDPAQNTLSAGINVGRQHRIGSRDNTVNYLLNGYLADIHFIDGQALDPTSFGEFSATTGVWVPKAYSGGSYGTNGFRLDFADNSSNTATTLGKDTSGNGNNWTPNNLSVTAGAGNDSLIDVPVNGSEVDTGLGGQVRGNYATFLGTPSAAVASNFTRTNGNLDASGSNANQLPLPASIFPSSGKWYCELVRTSGSGARLGVVNVNGLNESLGNGANGWCFLDDGRVFYNGSASSYGSAIATNDIFMIALDIGAGKVWYGNNGTWFASGNPATGANASQSFTAGQTITFAVATGGACAFTSNWGARPFAYTAPSGFKALCTANLPAPTIVKPSTVFDTKLYTSNAGTLTVSGLGFSPDFAWLKSRGTAVAHALYDTVRGAGYALSSNLTDAEKYTTDGFVSFNSDGFTLGANVNSPQPDINYTNNIARVAWCWDAGSSTVTNTAGSISSQVRANPSAGFSVVTYTGTGGTATVGHGLGIAPSFILIKERSPNTDNWNVYHSSIGASAWLQLNLTNATSTGSEMWNSTSPTSTVVTVRNPGSGGYSNRSGAAYVAYCFAPVAGYSSMGSWQNNGSNDGTFVYLGFRPKFILLKNTDNVERWYIMDSSRHTYNVPPADATKLQPNLSDAEGTGLANTATIDFLSNGFKIRTTNTASGEISFGTRNYIYAAFAEAPFQYARAR
jgi:hypothetical protein